jgi:hypothetical protein
MCDIFSTSIITLMSGLRTKNHNPPQYSIDFCTYHISSCPFCDWNHRCNTGRVCIGNYEHRSGRSLLLKSFLRSIHGNLSLVVGLTFPLVPKIVVRLIVVRTVKKRRHRCAPALGETWWTEELLSGNTYRKFPARFLCISAFLCWNEISGKKEGGEV